MVFSRLKSLSFEIILYDFSYISSFTFVTGLKLPLIARIFFLYRTAAGSMFLPSGPNITAWVMPFFTKSKLSNLLSTFSKRGPEKLIVSISIAWGSM